MGQRLYSYDAENHLLAVPGATYSYDGDGKRLIKSTGTIYWYGIVSDYPFGGERPIQSAAGNTWKFTGKERDPESGLDNFVARYYSSGFGRFMSPDPMGNFLADAANPQTWNLYSYVLNNPLVAVDPNGLWCVWQDGSHDGIPDEGGADSQTCVTQGGLWDATNSLTGCDASWTCMMNNGATSLDLSGICGDNYGCTLNNSTTVQVTATAPDLPYTDFHATGISAQTDWSYSKQADCIASAAKVFVGGLVLKGEIDSTVDFLSGQDPDRTIPGIGTKGTGAVVVEKGLDAVAENRNVVRTIKGALREGGVKASGNGVARAARIGGKAALAAHVLFAALDGREEYVGCMN